MAFVLEHLCDIDDLLELSRFDGIDRDAVMGVLEEFGRFMSEVAAPINALGDEVGAIHHPDGRVVMPEEFQALYQQYLAAGWGAVPFDPAYGGGGFPWVVNMAMHEMMNSANMAFAMGPLLTQGAIDALVHHGSETLKEIYLAKMVSGEWSGTMNLTEPDAGSDVGALRSKAEPVGDGSWRVSGTKIYISFGEHDLTENIVHLVLARTPDSPPGTKGISLFLVPKVMVNDDGSLGEPNDVTCVSIEHKMGIKASPTCVLSFGENDGAIGWLVGEEHQGMRAMFTMMNNARLAVGNEGLGLSEVSQQAAVSYAQERLQGRAPGAEKGTKSPIVDHADVRRMLMTNKARIEAMRALVYYEAAVLDRSNYGPEPEREASHELAELLTPIAKAWCTDMVNEVTGTTIQVHGGMGFVEETGVAQYYRDAKITSIYEGTNGIQAMDLVGRKLPMRAGGVMTDFIASMRGTATEAAAVEGLASTSEALAASLDTLETATNWLLENGLTDINNALAAATSFQRLFGVVTAGALLCRSALAAHGLLAGGAADDGFLAAKIVTARFFAEQLLPEADLMLAQVTAGPDDLYAIASDALWMG
jgi:alkylation response protein AidB-like acyl-CoA dehydrogenase